jgi:hypothetical protein
MLRTYQHRHLFQIVIHRINVHMCCESYGIHDANVAIELSERESFMTPHCSCVIS